MVLDATNQSQTIFFADFEILVIQACPLASTQTGIQTVSTKIIIQLFYFFYPEKINPKSTKMHVFRLNALFKMSLPGKGHSNSVALSLCLAANTLLSLLCITEFVGQFESLIMEFGGKCIFQHINMKSLNTVELCLPNLIEIKETM